MLGVAINAMMNLRLGVRTSHYAITVFSAIFGAAVSARQILLHIIPGKPNGPSDGSPVLVLHLYTWGLIIFMATIGIVGLLMLYEKHFDLSTPASPRPMSKPVMAVFALVIFPAAANIFTTFLMCELAPCLDSSEQYLLLNSV